MIGSLLFALIPLIGALIGRQLLSGFRTSCGPSLSLNGHNRTRIFIDDVIVVVTFVVLVVGICGEKFSVLLKNSVEMATDVTFVV